MTLPRLLVAAPSRGSGKSTVAIGIAAALHGRRGERYILGGENLWYRDLIATTAQVTGRRPPTIPLSRSVTRGLGGLVDFLARAGVKTPADGDQIRFSAETLWFDSGKARRELGLHTRPYRDAAQRAYDWYKANGYLK